MKRIKFSLCLYAILAIVLISSCEEDEGYHQVSSLERDIYLNINEYRSSNNLGTLVEQFLIFKESRVIAEELVAGTYGPADPQPQQIVEEMATNLGGDSGSVLLLTTGFNNADSIVNALTEDPSTVTLIKGEYNQCGVGVATDKDNINHVAIMLINIPD